MSAIDLLAELRALSVRAVAEGWQLRFFAPAGVLSAELRARVAVERSMLIEALRREQGIALPGELPALRSDWPEEWIEAFEERAAVMEFDAGITRAEAERNAEESTRREAARVAQRDADRTESADRDTSAPSGSGDAETVRDGNVELWSASLFGDDSVVQEDEVEWRARHGTKQPSGGAA